MDIFVSTTCPMCAPVKAEVARLGNPPGVRLRVIDQDEAATRDFRALGATGVPVAMINGTLAKGAMPIIAELKRLYGKR